MTTEDEKEFWILAVKLLFRQIGAGKITFDRDRVPQTLQALESVHFDGGGDPVYETISGPVRALANLVYTHEVERLEKEAEEREKDSPVHELLGAAVEINEDILRACSQRSHFSRLAFELYKEAGAVVIVSSHSYISEEPREDGLDRNQAICAGLLVRIAKFMIAITQLVATSDAADRGEVVLALNRCLSETAINLMFLATKNEGRFYDQFVQFSLGPERELHDVIQENIKERGGRALPIEKRMLTSIERICRASGVQIEDVSPKHRDWGGSVRDKLRALGQERSYVGVQRVPSHAVHGTWVDLLFHHLEVKGAGFTPDPSWSVVDSRQLCPAGIMVLGAASAYLNQFFGDLPELRPLYRRMDDLLTRLRKVDESYETWFQNQGPRGVEDTGDDPSSDAT